jgi:hypothetical protein
VISLYFYCNSANENLKYSNFVWRKLQQVLNLWILATSKISSYTGNKENNLT